MITLQGQLPCLSGRPEPDADHEPELPEHPGRVQRYRPIEMTQTFVEVQRAVTKVGQIVILVLMAVSIITVGSTIRLSVFAAAVRSRS